ncbi:MAG: dynamin family protein [Acidimicrobiia bacterium]
MAELAEVLDLMDLAAVRSREILGEHDRTEVVAVVERARTRHGFVGEVLVVAVAGGTGSGKSSVVNALVGHEVVDTGVVRPTTQDACAIYPQACASDLGPMLDALGVLDRIPTAALDDVVLVDLPDFDSIKEAHRHVVDLVLPRVDAVVWVMDPEKYADPLVHDEFLGELVDHEPQFLFVLNQLDRIEADHSDVVGSLRGHLLRDGFADPVVVGASASPRDGSDPEVSQLVEAIEWHLDVKTTALSKLAVDLRAAANAGWRACRTAGIETDDDDQRWEAALAAATFVTLGVAAYEMYARTTTAHDARSDTA